MLGSVSGNTSRNVVRRARTLQLRQRKTINDKINDAVLGRTGLLYKN